MKSFQMFVLQGKLIGNPVCQDTPYGEMALVQIEETSFFHEDCHQIHRVYIYLDRLGDEISLAQLTRDCWVRVIGKLLKRDMKVKGKRIIIDEIIAEQVTLLDATKTPFDLDTFTEQHSSALANMENGKLRQLLTNSEFDGSDKCWYELLTNFDKIN
ncbi:hypothetical protein E6P75_08535 [Moraxella osloensis]|jgi:hypothetical protein|uniref:Uncharacterized protein n=1 Tax=Faucicola osloensis TaxID=34062 RepID=A0AAW6TIP2_FAUOS|nr:hypothetical protein [Moraxella osloensis]MDI4510252.1 hypothetical protein [Moraxella osloensis]